MYFKFVFLCLAVANARAAPATDVVPLEKQQPTVIPIVSQSEELESNGTYKFSYETGNGIKREETSYDKVLPKVAGRSADSNEGGESDESNEIHVQRGSYSYTAPDGTLISVTYIADENGFQPVGDHIPQSIVAAAAAGGSSSEKSGRSLNVGDSANSASVPKSATAAAPSATQTASQTTPESTPIEPQEKEPEAASESASTASEVSTTEAAKASEATTENASEASPSTTEAGTTAAAVSEVTDASEGSTAAEATTRAADATTVAASEEPSSTSADASTTEAVSTASV